MISLYYKSKIRRLEEKSAEIFARIHQTGASIEEEVEAAVIRKKTKGLYKCLNEAIHFEQLALKATKKLVLFLLPFLFYYWMRFEGFSKDDSICGFVPAVFVVAAASLIIFLEKK